MIQMEQYGQNSGKKQMRTIWEPIRSKALSHVFNVLDYENFLCACVRTQVDFQKGTFLTTIPANKSFEDIEDFSWGNGEGHDTEIGSRLIKSLKSCPDNLIVVDDVMADSTAIDAFSVVNRGEIFHWMTAADATDDALKNLVWTSAVSWHFLAVIFSNGASADVPQRIAGGECETLGDIIEVIVGAYDGEGFIHWVSNS
ncbi:MAG: hypothetical protein ACRYGK_03045 [Janthinobacterium lividum]